MCDLPHSRAKLIAAHLCACLLYVICKKTISGSRCASIANDGHDYRTPSLLPLTSRLMT